MGGLRPWRAAAKELRTIMAENDNRQIARDSLFVMADLRIDGQDTEHRIKMRNLSAGGLMAEGPVRVVRGMIVWISLRNLGWVEGSVAWVQDNRFGIAFREEIDPRVARVPLHVPPPEGLIVRRPVGALQPLDDGRIRKV